MPAQYRALLVDDDELQRTVASLWIESLGFKVFIHEMRNEIKEQASPGWPGRR